MVDTENRDHGPILVVGIVLTVALGLSLFLYLSRALDREQKRAADHAISSQMKSAKIDAPPILVLPAFTLDRARGGTLGRDDLLGKVWICDFFYSTCPTACPIMSGRMAKLQDALRGLSDLQLVSITVDPETDTAEKLQTYANNYGADPKVWSFLTGDEAKIRKLKHEGFRMGDPEDPIAGHSLRFILVDAQGRMRATYHCATPESPEDEFDRLIRDTRELVRRGGE